MKKGFTLLELLVVVLIIGVLAAVALPMYNKAVARSRFIKLYAMARIYERAVQEYLAANGEWPSYFDELTIEAPTNMEVKNPNSANCIQNNEVYCCMNTARAGYQNSGITCGLLNYTMGHTFEYKSAAGGSVNRRWCIAKKTDTAANDVCLSYNPLRSTYNLPTPTGHKTGYYYYQMPN